MTTQLERTDAVATADPALPGRLSDDTATYGADHRAHRELLAALAPFGLGERAPTPEVARADGIEAVREFLVAAEEGFHALFSAIPTDLPSGEGVEQSTLTIPGRDGNEITLYVFRPAGSTGTQLPGVVYLHGGGMVILFTDNVANIRWCEDLARSGMVVVLPDFRNGGGARGPHPFPAGAHDCFDAFSWVSDHRDDLGMTTLTLQGESGGANLCISTALQAKAAGLTDRIHGLYTMVPYISGAYGWSVEDKRGELPSLVENDGYFLDTHLLDLLVAAYDPDDQYRRDPLAWPYWASVDQLRGLPPHVVSVNELDPLRDEGLAYFRKLQAAGVDASGRMNLGIVHAADNYFRTPMGDQYLSTVADIHRFASRP